MHLLKRLIHRRQLLLSGLALAVLSPRAVQAKEQQASLFPSHLAKAASQ